jgi:cytochrome oxidase Cu insertion factor (SCO1/SenC/PrrC family)
MTKPQKILTIGLWAIVGLAALGFTAVYRLARENAAAAQPPGAPVVALDAKSPTADGELPVLFEAPAFELTDQDNQRVTAEQLKGRPWIASFVFTHCAGPCPMMFSKMSGMQKAAADADVKLVSFTVDPERDTPEVLKKKAAELDAQPGRWVFLTGTKEQIDTAARAMLQVRPGPGDNPLMHSTRFLLFDAQNRCRGRYDSSDEAELAKLTKDAAMLATQAKGATKS